MTVSLIVAWWLAGMIGGLLLWLDYKMAFPKEVGRCPTRAGCLLIVISGVAGIGILLGALILTLVGWVQRSVKGDGWWSKPVC